MSLSLRQTFSFSCLPAAGPFFVLIYTFREPPQRFICLTRFFLSRLFQADGTTYLNSGGKRPHTLNNLLPHYLSNPLPHYLPNPLPHYLPNPLPHTLPNPLLHNLPNPLPHKTPNPYLISSLISNLKTTSLILFPFTSKLHFLM